jgi:uncharacterized protein YcbK (DUF882 family)
MSAALGVAAKSIRGFKLAIGIGTLGTAAIVFGLMELVGALLSAKKGFEDTAEAGKKLQALKDVSISIEAGISGKNKEIVNLEKDVESAEDKVKQLQDAMVDMADEDRKIRFTNEIERQNEIIREGTEEIERHQKVKEQLIRLEKEYAAAIKQTELSDIKAQYEAINLKIIEASESLDDLNERMSSPGRGRNRSTIQGMREDAVQAEQEIRILRLEAQRLGLDLVKVAKETEDAAEELDEFASAGKKAQDAVEGVGQTLIDADLQLKKYTTGLAEAVAELDNVGNTEASPFREYFDIKTAIESNKQELISYNASIEAVRNTVITLRDAFNELHTEGDFEDWPDDAKELAFSLRNASIVLADMTGHASGLLGRMNELVQAAKDFYDEHRDGNTIAFKAMNMALDEQITYYDDIIEKSKTLRGANLERYIEEKDLLAEILKAIQDTGDEYLRIANDPASTSDKIANALKERNEQLELQAEKLAKLRELAGKEDYVENLGKAAKSSAKSFEELTTGYKKLLDPNMDKQLVSRFKLMVKEEQLVGQVTSAYRSKAKQAELHAKHLRGEGPLAAAAGKSLHNYGKAIDYVVGGTKKLTDEMAAQYGLKLLHYKNSNHVHITALKTVQELAAEEKNLSKEREEANKVLAESAAIVVSNIQDAQVYLKSKEDEIKMLGMSAEAQAAYREELEITAKVTELLTRADEAYRNGELKKAQALRDSAKYWEEIKDKAIEYEVILAKSGREADAFSEIMTGALEEIGRSIQENLADAFRSMFDGSLNSAEDFAKALKDTILNAIAEMAAQIAYQKIVVPMLINPVMGAMGGSPAGGGAGYGGITGDPNTNIFGAFGKAGQAASGLARSFGLLGGATTGLASATGGALGYIQGAIGLGGASQAAVMGAQGGLAGMGAANAALGGMGGALGAIGSFASAALPVVGAIAALGSITGVFDGLFGSDKKFPGVHSTIQGGQLVPLDAQDLSPEQYAQARDGISQFNSELRAFAESWGPDAVASLERWSTDSRMDSADSFGKSLEEWLEEGTRVALYGAREGIARDFYEVSAAMGDSFTSAMEGVADSPEAITAARDAAIQIFAQLLESVQAIRGSGAEELLNLSKDNTEAADQLYWTAKNMGKSVGEMLTNFSALEMGLVAMGRTADSFSHWSSPAFAALVGADFAEGAGGMERFAAGYQVFYDQFLSQVERDAMALDGARKRISSVLGDDALSQYDSRDAYMAALESTDLSSEASRRLHGQLIALAGAFDLVFDAAEAAAEVSDELATNLKGLTAEQSRTVEEFLSSIKPPEDGVEQWERLQSVMRSWGVDIIPRTEEALYNLMQSGQLTGEQMLALANNADDLAAAFAHVSDEAKALEDFVASLKPPPDGAEQWERLQRVFTAWGVAIPMNEAALYELIQAGKLTDEQILLLAEHSLELAAAFEEVRRQEVEAIENEYARMVDAANAAYEAQRDAIQDAYDAQVEAIRDSYDAQVEAVRDFYAAAIEAVRDAEQEALEEATEIADARRDMVNDAYEAEVERINDIYEERREGLDKELEAMQEYVSELEGMAKSLSDAIRGFVAEDELFFDRSRRQLAELAASGRVPGTDELDRILQGVSQGGEYSSQSEQNLAEAQIRADLMAVEAVVGKQLTDAEKQLAAIEQQIEMLEDWRDEQLKQADEIRESQLEAIDDWEKEVKKAIQESAEAQIEALQEAEEAQLEALQESMEAQMEAAEAQRDRQLEQAEAAHKEQLAQAEAWKEEELAKMEEALYLQEQEMKQQQEAAKKQEAANKEQKASVDRAAEATEQSAEKLNDIDERLLKQEAASAELHKNVEYMMRIMRKWDEDAVPTREVA